ncbi:MAG: hypothetical protein ACK5IN_01140 [Microbacterium sp.]|uniref:hypothetical protein n=1 Tax=Microbacterium sp. TaxID=51671 RepID=UPI003A873F65
MTSLALAAFALSACVPEPVPGATTPAPTPTGTGPVTTPPPPTPAETEEPAPPASSDASPDDPLAALNAWSICAGIATEYFPMADWQRDGYRADAVHDQGGGTFAVTVTYTQTTGGGAGAIDCIVGGTLGAPEVLVTGPHNVE